MKIIIPIILFISMAVPIASEESNVSQSALSAESLSSFDLMGRYDVDLGAQETQSIISYDLFSDDGANKEAVGVFLNAQQGSYEAAIGYGQTPNNQKMIKGRVTYKSRNNSKVQVDIVAEKLAVSSILGNETDSGSVSFMVGAKYKLTQRAYVAGQYGAIGFNQDKQLPDDELSSNRDYNAMSLEAGYSLSESSAIFVKHSQKSYDGSLFSPIVDSDGSQVNSVGVRLNW